MCVCVLQCVRERGEINSDFVKKKKKISFNEFKNIRVVGILRLNERDDRSMITISNERIIIISFGRP